MLKTRTVLVTGGAGYVGAVLIPKLLREGHSVRVLDLFLYGDDVFDAVKNDSRLTLIKGDIRSRSKVDEAMAGCDTVLHLACISNDPSFELDPDLGKSINYDAFYGLVDSAKALGVSRFIYASSSSVYGVKSEANVTEDLSLEPLTDYSRYKALCEDALTKARETGFTTLIIRPATVCGYSPRLRLDLSVNILTHHAVEKGKITVFGGAQKRPNIHIQDMTDLYVKTLQWSDADIDGKIYNVGYENHSLDEIADMVRAVVGDHVEITHSPSNDMRSYHISSEKIRRELGFSPRYTIRDAVVELVAAFKEGRISNAADPKYYNIRTMQNVGLK